MTKTTSDSSKSGKRKGTRSVSTLTPSQLARKRANDREAQRAIRARTKEHIESLERELEDLRSTQSRDETVQGLMKRNRALEAELHRLRESMGMPSSSPASNYQHTYHSQSSRASSYTPNDVASYDNISAAGDPWTPAVTCSIASTVSSPSSSGVDDFGSAYFPTSAPSSMVDRPAYSSNMNSPVISRLGGKMGYEELEPASRNGLHTAQSRLHAGNLPPDLALERLPGILPGVPNPLSESPHNAEWNATILVTPPSCQNDALLMGYIRDCRRLATIAGGRPHPEVLFGPACPNIRPLLEPHAAHIFNTLHGQNLSSSTSSTPTHPLVTLAVAIYDNDNLATALERVGGFVIFQRLLSWLIHPTQETYSCLGDLAPRPSQRAIPHSQWIDFILWGQLRDTVIQRQEFYATPEFRHVYSANLRLLNWDGGLSTAFLLDHSTGAICLTDTFVGHVLNIENWALMEDFARRYPELGGSVPIERGNS